MDDWPQQTFTLGATTSAAREGEPFELVVGSQRTEAIPRPMQTPATSGAAQADLGVRIAVNATDVGPLRLAGGMRDLGRIGSSRI